ncbi:nucleotidyltransferase domain-containing protein [Natroniella sulfidigena]|uniref:nucleotidyltransferase domain-containing protein n=1 Tax=Natroniella sulfidigena TaxID=723921 RepID=UPI00200B8F8D|nr:nucleotidyltransferase domain-containing protein [Natroniella sulfidigena]MCK8816324.1 nucleotidyltransferase domain-containing protein [Natroniella sulfidigena]
MELLIDRTINQDKIDEIINKLVDAYSPEVKNIYLFGSYAWGSPTADSDLDLLIVVEDSDKKPYKRAVKGHRALRGVMVAVDILVYTAEEFDVEKNNEHTLCYKIINEGVKVYGS